MILIDAIVVYLNFIFGFMQSRYSKVWDQRIIHELNNGDFEEIGGYCSKLGRLVLWTYNFPYACFTLYGYIDSEGDYVFATGDISKVRPSLITIIKAKQKLRKVVKRRFSDGTISQKLNSL